MQVNVNGMWETWPDDTPKLILWDESLSANPAGLGDNRGCPPGYFCEYTSSGKICRLMESQIVNDGGRTLASETGPGWWESTIINVADATRMPVEAIRDVLPSPTAFGIGAGAVLALLAVYFLWRR